MTDSASVTRRDARRRLQRLVDEQIAERSDHLYIHKKRRIETLGETALSAGLEKSQMNKLERHALSASTFGAVADYVKSQMGRDTSTGEIWSDSGFGRDLLNNLNATIDSVDEDTKALLGALDDRLLEALRQSDEDPEAARTRLSRDLARRLRMGYAQALVEHVVAHYSYKASLTEG